MPTNSSWIPKEDAQVLLSERCWLQGAIIGSIVYGISVPLFFISFRLLASKKTGMKFRVRLPLLIYTVISFFLGTLVVFSLAAFTQKAFIDDRNYPGGPSAYELDKFSIPISNAGNVAYILSNWLSDALVVWRFKVIYQKCCLPLWVVMLFPCLLLAGCITIGIMSFVHVSTTNLFTPVGIDYILTYIGLSLTLNIILPIAIVARLLVLRRQIISVLGAKYGARYMSVVAMLVESAALLLAVSITFLILFAIGNPVREVFIQFLSQFQTLATLLIVYRVAQGKGWTEDTATRVSMRHEPRSIELGNVRPTSMGTSPTLADSGNMAEHPNDMRLMSPSE